MISLGSSVVTSSWISGADSGLGLLRASRGLGLDAASGNLPRAHIYADLGPHSLRYFSGSARSGPISLPIILQDHHGHHEAVGR